MLARVLLERSLNHGELVIVYTIVSASLADQAIIHSHMDNLMWINSTQAQIAFNILILRDQLRKLVRVRTMYLLKLALVKVNADRLEQQSMLT